MEATLHLPRCDLNQSVFTRLNSINSGLLNRNFTVNPSVSSFTFPKFNGLKNFSKKAIAFRKSNCLRKRNTLFVNAVLKESQVLQMGSRIPEFELVEPLTGKIWSLDDFEGAPALLVIFMCNHCPFVVHLKKGLSQLCEEFISKGIAVVAISSNSIITHPQDGPAQMAEDAKILNYPFPYLYDETQEVAKRFRAACTPDFYVYKKEGRRPFELFYHGQMDDSRPSNGVPVTGKSLRMALDCAVACRPLSIPQKPSIGCNIKWSPGSEPDYF